MVTYFPLAATKIIPRSAIWSSLASDLWQREKIEQQSRERYDSEGQTRHLVEDSTQKLYGPVGWPTSHQRQRTPRLLYVTLLSLTFPPSRG